MTKSFNLTFKIIVLLVLMIIILSVCVGCSGDYVAQKSEELYYLHQEELYQFVAICFQYRIGGIFELKSKREYDTEYYISNYYVYTKDKLPEEAIAQLKILLNLFREYSIKNIYVDEEKCEYVSIVISGSFCAAVLEYTSVYKPIESFIDYPDEDDAFYLDDHWVLIYNKKNAENTGYRQESLEPTFVPLANFS